MNRQDVMACLAHYPALGRVVRATAIAEGQNTLFRVTAERGAFYLKVLSTNPEASTEEQYEYLDWAMQLFANTGVAVPLAVRNAEGRRLTPCGPYPAVLSAALGGSRFRAERLLHYRAAGRALGLFHREGAGAAARSSAWVRPLGGYLAEVESMRDRLPDLPETRPAVERFPELLRLSEEVAHELRACSYRNLPHTTVHQEVVGKHVRMQGGRVVSVLDFEYAIFEARIVDVTISLTRLRAVGPYAVEDGPARTCAFLRGYASAGWPLAPEELAALPVVAKAWDFELIPFWMDRLIETGRSPGFMNLESFLPWWFSQAQWWDEHGDEVVDLLRQAQQ